MARGLLDRLGQRPASSGDELESITSHLQALLNSRMGFSPTVPDFGIVDFNSVIHTMPDGVAVLQQSMQGTIQRFESRLEHVRVVAMESIDPLILRFEIQARLRRSRRVIRLQTRVMPGGVFEVS